MGKATLDHGWSASFLALRSPIVQPLSDVESCALDSVTLRYRGCLTARW